jgi:very-short-patch-repair endonuclease
MNDASAHIIDLLTYIEQVEKLKTKPPFSVPTDYFVAYQHELKGLPELQFNLEVDGDDVWLRLPRLREIAAPALVPELEPWVTLSKSPEKPPELKHEWTKYENKQEVDREQLVDCPAIMPLFEQYLVSQWEPWASMERPRRKTIARYNQLFALQQTITMEGSETPLELVWGIGMATWKKEGFSTPVKYPLLVQSCEVTLNERTFDLEVRPRDMDARLETDCYAEMELSGVHSLDSFWKNTLATGVHRVNPFEESTFEGVLKAAVGHLDPTGAYESKVDDLAPSAPSEKLQVTNGWVLFGRKRSGDIFMEDIRRLKDSVAAATSLPGVIRSFVESGDTTVRVRPEMPFRGLSTSDNPSNAFELYFPMAYNEEQVSIIQKLESNDGVVVQGPPGTGKTHTIANVICHYLAQGKRVLVTAKGESALAVLQEKLPERIRPLSVALLSDERDGMKQFEHAIQTIASNVASLSPQRSLVTIQEAEFKLNTLHAQIAHVDQTVSSYAAKHMQHYMFQGASVSPEGIAKLVTEQAEMHQWFEDALPFEDTNLVTVSDGDISALRQARRLVGEDLGYLTASLPAVDELPAWSSLCVLHRDLAKASTLDMNIAQGQIIGLVNAGQDTLEKTAQLLTFLEHRSALMTKLAHHQAPWHAQFEQRLRTLQPDDIRWQHLQTLFAEIHELEETRRCLLSNAVVLEPNAENNAEFTDAMARLVVGKSAFLLPLGKGVARKLLAEVTTAGARPTALAGWQQVQQVVEWRLLAKKSLARWNAMASEFGLAQEDCGDLETAFKAVVNTISVANYLQQGIFDFEAHLSSRIAAVFGLRVVASRDVSLEPLFLREIMESAQAHVDKGSLTLAHEQLGLIAQKLDSQHGGVVAELRSFLTTDLGQPNADEAVLQTTWQALQAELLRVTSLRPALNDILRVASLLERAGAPKWAHRVREEQACAEYDVWTPANWLEAWNWRKAVSLLEGIDGHQKLRALFDERTTLTASLASTYQDLVAEKTWLGVFNNSPDSVRQALQAYLVAVQKMGAGTGVRAIRHRKTARDAMLRAYQAVPCWVLPQWRISETIPAEVGLFDLVVIDEASQSDIWALPALLRGKKLLIVGDHKQVSPSAVGMAEEKIKELSTRFLSQQPHGAQMTPDQSIYDLARVVFAGNSVMLKEHFRCVPAIIEFSNREFYQGDIRPLRLPKFNERLDPPLVDVYVKGGFRKGDVNPAEALAIVAEIESILKDAQFNGRTLGVVTLMGTAQAAHIQELVSQRISPIDVLARKIAVGPPPVFQGRERDIMMVSMVLGPNDRATLNKADMHQRFNVALSRARDRMYLFRSVTEATFKEDTLNSRLIRHFRQPFRQNGQKIEELRAQCESGFELEMFDELVRRGYRVLPQVPCGGFRIDFVVEGNEGRRLAVECDGDRFHGPGQWSADMARQRVLERAGWTFWRCFASSFVRRRDEVMNELCATLERLGIEPLGSDSVDNTVWTHTKEVDPFSVTALMD